MRRQGAQGSRRLVHSAALVSGLRQTPQRRRPWGASFDSGDAAANWVEDVSNARSELSDAGLMWRQGSALRSASAVKQPRTRLFRINADSGATSSQISPAVRR